jgi:hypothetical protein
LIIVLGSRRYPFLGNERRTVPVPFDEFLRGAVDIDVGDHLGLLSRLYAGQNVLGL